jgi:hypothetical protein
MLFGRSMELCGIDHSGVGTETTTSSRFNSAYGIRAAAFANSGVVTDWIGVNKLDGGPYVGDFWHRGFMATVGVNSGRTLLEYCDDAGVPVFRLQQTATTTLQAQYWDGGAWVDIGATYVLATNTLFKYDLKIVTGASFDFAITSNMGIEPSSVLAGAASMPLVTNIDRIRAYMNGNSGQMTAHSEWLWGDEPTVGHRYAWRPPSGDGTHTAGSGTFADVDEAVTSDLDVSTLAANGDAETYVHAAMTLPTVGTAKAVQLEARVRRVVGGAQNVKGRLRVGGVDYDQASNFAGIDSAYAPYVPQWATNPAGGNWTLTTAGQVSNEFGLLAQT